MSLRPKGARIAGRERDRIIGAGERGVGLNGGRLDKSGLQSAAPFARGHRHRPRERQGGISTLHCTGATTNLTHGHSGDERHITVRPHHGGR